MNSFKWAAATTEFNRQSLRKSHTPADRPMRKHTRVLMEKSQWVEARVLGRIARQDFKGEFVDPVCCVVPHG